MGASAYGLDQMYLWYEEDGAPFQADIVICAIIADDLERVFHHKVHSGHGKPVFAMNQGKLTLTNIPVPRRVAPGALNRHPRDSFVEFARFQRRQERSGSLNPEEEALLVALLGEFKTLVERTDKEFFLVYLPDVFDLYDHKPVRRLLSRVLNGQVIDVTEYFKERISPQNGPPLQVFRMDGHYNALGNSIIADAVYSHLSKNSRLQQFGESTTTGACLRP